MSAKDFIDAYEVALGTQDWAQVAPLIRDDARVIFSNGTLHIGKQAIKAAYERNFNAIKNEDYRIENIHWCAETNDSASYMFEYYWTGVIDGRQASGAGRGTAVLAFTDGRWMLVAEHLGPKS